MDRERTGILLAFLLLGVGMVTATVYPTVESLPYTCTYEGTACTATSDVTSGICRTLTFSTVDGNIVAQVCHKDGGRYEVYRQAFPGGDFQVCVDEGCVNEVRGYDSFEADPLGSDEGGYVYLDPSTFSESCTFNGVACEKLSDTTAGTCRTILYNVDEDADEDIATLVCHKGDSRYEFYRVFAPEGDLYATLGIGFVDELKGYDSFTVSEPVTPPPPPPPVCSGNSVDEIDATCDGNITSDTFDGSCRSISCDSGAGQLNVLACDKPDGQSQYFEMYRQSYSGEPVTICLDGTCLDGDLRGFARSEPYCTV
jgi:hypothetical protein